MDKFIVDQSPDVKNHHFLLRNRIKMVKDWWVNNPWFSASDSYTRRLVQNSTSKILNQMDKYLVSPLMKLIFQLCFTHEAGIFNSNYIKIHLEVPKKYCGAAFVEFLEYLGPFQIEKLYNVNMMYGSPEPLIVILKNSPCLKLIHLRYNSSDYVLKHIGKFCPNLETFVVDQCYGRLLITERYLYKCFYCGLEKVALQEKLIRNEPVPTSFPKLKYLDFGKHSMISDFLSNLRVYYPHLESISCNSSSFPAEQLVKVAKVKPFEFPYFIVDLGLTSECILTLDKETVWKLLPSIKHITLSLDSVPEEKFNVFSSNVKAFLLSANVSSLTFHLPFYNIGAENVENICVSILEQMGHKIKALQFDIKNVIDIRILFKLINLCSQIELLTLRLSKDAPLRGPLSKSVKLKVMKSVKYLCIRYIERETMQYFTQVVEEILVHCPNVIALELMVPLNSNLSCMKLAPIKEVCQNVEVLTLQLIDSLTFQAGFFVSFIEQFPHLRTLILIDLPYSVYVGVTSRRKNYNFEILSSHFSKVSYRGLASKYPVLYSSYR